MRYIEDDLKFIPQESGIEGIYKMMEMAARTCYQTFEFIKDGSAERIIDNICIKAGHTSVLEFGTVYLTIKFKNGEGLATLVGKYLSDRFSRVVMDYGVAYVTTTYRTIIQGDYKDLIEAIKNKFDKSWKDDLQYMTEPTEFHHKRYAFSIICDRGGSQSFERHRGNYGISYAQESTRFVNYTKKKFDNNIRISVSSKFYELIDSWIEEGEEWLKDATLDERIEFLRKNDFGWSIYEHSIATSEADYFSLVKLGWKPEDARGVLNLDIATNMMMCGYVEDFRIFLFRRLASDAHGHAQRIANLMSNEFKKIGVEFTY